MSTVSSLTPQAQNQPGNKSIDDQIGALEKRISEGVKSGSLTPQQGKTMIKALDEVQKILDDSAGAANLSGADSRKIAQMLRGVARALGSPAPDGAGGAAGSGADSDGDNDGSGGVSTLA